MKKTIIISVSFLFALILNLMPLPSWTEWWRPDFVLLTLMFWALFLPRHVSVGLAWIIGLFMDVINNTVLGAHALAFTLVCYLLAKFCMRIRVFPYWQKLFAILLLLLAGQIILFSVYLLVHGGSGIGLFWLPVITGALLWQAVAKFLEKMCYNFMLQAD